MRVAPEPTGTPTTAYPICCVLPLVPLPIDASATWVRRALLSYAERADEVLLSGPGEAVLLPGRWHAQAGPREHAVHYGLTTGPLPGLTCTFAVWPLEGGRALLECEGTYVAPSRPLLERRRVRQLAEGLRAGLLVSLQDALAPGGELRRERRAAPRHALSLPVRLRLGDVPWPAALRDVSVGGIGVLVPAPAREVPSIAALIGEHSLGALELLFNDGRLTARVRIKRAAAAATAVDVGLEVGPGADRARLESRLAALGLWAVPGPLPACEPVSQHGA